MRRHKNKKILRNISVLKKPYGYLVDKGIIIRVTFRHKYYPTNLLINSREIPVSPKLGSE